MWSADYFLSKARSIGPETEKMISTVLKSREYEVQSYRTCVGILNLSKKYGSLLESACKHANDSGLRSYKAVNTIIKTLKEASLIPTVPLDDSVSDEMLNSLYCAHEQEDTHVTF